MKTWTKRTYEERHLLNPAFCSMLLWHSSKGAMREAISPRSAIFFIESFLILPLVLQSKARNSLPRNLRTSMPVWINSQSLVITKLPLQTKSLVPYTKEAILFGERSGVFSIEGEEIIAKLDIDKDVKDMLKDTSDEVRECAKKAEFLGRWFAHTGLPETIYTLLGLKP